MPIDPVVGVIGAAAIAVGSAALYSWRTGEETSVGVDVDDDGNDDVSADFGGGNPSNAADTNVDEVSSTTDDVEEQANPTPSYVEDDYDELSDITGIGPTRAESLSDAGFTTPEDIYYATDANLEAVTGIGPHAVSQMRDDIGSVDDNPNSESTEDNSDGEEEAEADSFSTEETEAESSESDGSDSGQTEESTGSDSDGENASETDDSSSSDSDADDSEDEEAE